jgi:toxin-antitoxin system PIN domain toxin
LATLYDSGVWLALVFSSHPHHAAVKSAHSKASSRNPACFCRATQQSFLRLITTPAIQRAYGAGGLTNNDALRIRGSLLGRPEIRYRDEPPGFEKLWHDLAAMDSASPKVWMDAYLAAFAIRHGITLTTLDNDFRNFEDHGLKPRFPAP